jgi:hypothetical protein
MGCLGGTALFGWRMKAVFARGHIPRVSPGWTELLVPSRLRANEFHKLGRRTRREDATEAL